MSSYYLSSVSIHFLVPLIPLLLPMAKICSHPPYSKTSFLFITKYVTDLTKYILIFPQAKLYIINLEFSLNGMFPFFFLIKQTLFVLML